MTAEQPLGHRIALVDTGGFTEDVEANGIRLQCNGCLLALVPGVDYTFRNSVIQSIANEINGHPWVHFGVVVTGQVMFNGEMYPNMSFDWHQDGKCYLAVGNVAFIMEALCGMSRDGRASVETILFPLSDVPDEHVTQMQTTLQVNGEQWANLCEVRHLGNKTPKMIGDFLVANASQLQSVSNCFQSMARVWEVLA